MTLQDLNESVTVRESGNPFITEVFYRHGLIEQWGWGTNRIVELTVQAGHPAPEFAESAGSVVVRFRPKTRTLIPHITPEVGIKGDQVAILASTWKSDLWKKSWTFSNALTGPSSGTKSLIRSLGRACSK